VSYAAAGVDLSAAEENVRRIGPHVRSTHGPAVLGEFGAFAGLYQLTGMREPVLVASTDGVGTKLLVARQLNSYRTLGSDLVNLSVNDVLTTGARPLFFLDYVGVHAMEHGVLEELVQGMAAACRENGCALLGGETAQLPDLYAPGHFDLVGTVVGVVERDQIIDGSTAQPGDAVWALPSTGLHTNGYSLARQIIAGRELAEDIGGVSLGEALLAPHPSYLSAVQATPNLKAIAHITGGGVQGNLKRVLPQDVSAELEWGAWPVPPIFGYLQEHGGVDFEEMLRVFNMGLGMVLVTDDSATVNGAMKVGRIVARQAERVIIRR
jgi:phosphoribosylformylglycinamidine cyclo-ligase